MKKIFTMVLVAAATISATAQNENAMVIASAQNENAVVNELAQNDLAMVSTPAQTENTLVSTPAQTESAPTKSFENDFRRHHISITAGDNLFYPNAFSLSLFGAVAVSGTRGSYGVSYSYSLSRKFDLGADVSASVFGSAGSTSCIFNIMPTAKFTYYKKNNFSMFMEAAAGVGITNDGSVGFTFQANPLGLRFGNDKVAFVLKGGAGCRGFITLGVEFSL